MTFEKTKGLQFSKEILIEDYKLFGNLTKIAKKYTVNKNTVVYYFKKYNIVYNSKIRNYGVNHDYFSEINEEVFYWAGFIAADGCISIRKKFNNQNLIINLGEKDLSHLERFKSHIKSYHPIKKKTVKNSKINPKWNDRNTYCLTISSKKIFEDLKKFGIGPNKSASYDMPEWLINHGLISHFMRGYFDGDGCIYINKPSNKIKVNQARLSVIGSEKFINNFCNIIYNKLSITNKSISFRNKMTVITYGGNNLTYIVGKFLYENANVFLKRKQELWEKCCSLRTVR
jgi:intein-encoded DNA endonuclease-like protein